MNIDYTNPRERILISNKPNLEKESELFLTDVKEIHFNYDDENEYIYDDSVKYSAKVHIQIFFNDNTSSILKIERFITFSRMLYFGFFCFKGNILRYYFLDDLFDKITTFKINYLNNSLLNEIIYLCPNSLNIYVNCLCKNIALNKIPNRIHFSTNF